MNFIQSKFNIITIFCVIMMFNTFTEGAPDHSSIETTGALESSVNETKGARGSSSNETIVNHDENDGEKVNHDENDGEKGVEHNCNDHQMMGYSCINHDEDDFFYSDEDDDDDDDDDEDDEDEDYPCTCHGRQTYDDEGSTYNGSGLEQPSEAVQTEVHPESRV